MLRLRYHLAALAFLLAIGGRPAAAEFTEYRSIFVDRFDFTYNSPNIPAMVSAIETQMQKAADEGFTEVIWQVRGRGDALYNSNVEPPAAGLTPGFDPLQTALDAAHAHGLKLHAWLNATPLWNSSAPATPPAGHFAHNTNPSFRITGYAPSPAPPRTPELEPLSGWSNYSSVNPLLPEVHTHINSVASDIMANYAVDGIHLDYIRYIPGGFNFNRYPHDALSHGLFAEWSRGLDLNSDGQPDNVPLDGGDVANMAHYKEFVTTRITDLVRSVKQNVDAAEVALNRPMEVTASLFFEPNRAKNEYMQDFGRWINEGLLDVAMPMIYLSQLNDELFVPYLTSALSFKNAATGTLVAPTLASYLHMNPSRGGGVDLTLEEIQAAYDLGADGVGFYDFPAFFNAYSAADRQRIRDLFDDLATPPPPPPPGGPGNVLDDFEVDEGHFNWPYNTSPVSQTFGLANTTTIERVTTEHQGAGAASQELHLVSDGSAEWQLRHNSGIGMVAHPSGNVPLVADGYVGFWLKTDDAGITVRIGIDDPVGNTALERGTLKPVIADNEWHLYQWNLDDNGDWDAFAGGANGIIDAVSGTITIDSIWFAGSASAQIYLDTVSHNPAGPLAAAPIPGDYSGDGVVDAGDYAIWRATMGTSVPPGTGADGNADGQIDAADYVVWRKQMTVAAGTGSLHSPAVPEPATAALAAMALIAAACRKVSSSRPWQRESE